MSKIKYFTIFDKKAEVYQKPMVFPTAADAFRSVQFEMKNPDSYLAQWPEDYRLIEVGEFDTDTGTFENTGKLYIDIELAKPKEQVMPVGTAPVKE